MRPEQIDFADVLLASLVDFERKLNVLVWKLEALVKVEARLKGFSDDEVNAATSEYADTE
jgi:hypothetical protein